MSISEATVTLTLGELQTLQSEVKAAKAQVAELKKEIDQTRLGPDDNLVNQYRDAFLESMKIVRFAVGSLHPLTVRGWPFKSLFQVIDYLATLPGIDEDQRETVGDLKLFARECKEWEGHRARGVEQEMLHSDLATTPAEGVARDFESFKADAEAAIAEAERDLEEWGDTLGQ